MHTLTVLPFIMITWRRRVDRVAHVVPARRSGMFAGPGYVALFGLLALRVSRRTPGPVVHALSADELGSRTLTAVGLAVAVWLVSVAGARWLDRRGWTGPAERLLRRLTYGRR